MTTVGPELHHSSLTPPAPLVDPLESKLRFYQMPDATKNESIITPLSDVNTLLARFAFATHVNKVSKDSHDTLLSTTPEKRTMEDTARDFVEQTIGVPTVGNVYWQDETDSSPYWGAHNVIYSANYIKTLDHPHDDMKYMHQMSLLVHEFAHSTADTGDVITAFQTKNETGNNDIDIQNHLGMHVIKVEKTEQQPAVKMNGQFFEEAFAEETAARWREQFSSLIADTPTGKWPTGTRKLPIRFFDYDFSSVGPSYSTVSGYSAYPAYGLSLLSEKAGVDLYELMRLARQPERAIEAKKAFIHAVNSVEDGLYRKLRELQYTKEDFLEGLALVESIVNKVDTTPGE